MPNYIFVKSLLPKADVLTMLLVHVMFEYSKEVSSCFILF